MPPKLSMTKTALGKLTKPKLLELALSLGLVQGKKSILKEEIIQFILSKKTDELVEKFAQMVLSKSRVAEPNPMDDIEPSRHVTFNESVISESLIPSMLSTIAEVKPILKVNVIHEAKKCTSYDEVMDLLGKYPEYSKNREIRQIIKNLPDSDVETSVQHSEQSTSHVAQSFEQPIQQQHFEQPIQQQPFEQPQPVLQSYEPVDVKKSLNPSLQQLQPIAQVSTQHLEQFFEPAANVQKTNKNSKKIVLEQIRDAKQVADILKSIQNPTEVHLSVMSDVDYDMAKTFGH